MYNLTVDAETRVDKDKRQGGEGVGATSPSYQQFLVSPAKRNDETAHEALQHRRGQRQVELHSLGDEERRVHAVTCEEETIFAVIRSRKLVKSNQWKTFAFTPPLQRSAKAAESETTRNLTTSPRGFDPGRFQCALFQVSKSLLYIFSSTTKF
ncbi:hypothetical protein I7I51_03511 [Histoplasma capsulatum]|uniref:Uncharacterized protein n=1 Tax=Ajellomyces capsulatus TaxID=5037 RepID=A0A8A1M4E1_AJECA|nr:hypothetical protein I7I51_03511 [Histoplasma capsulatum]